MPLIQRFRCSSSTRFAPDALLSEAEILSEGHVATGDDGPVYTGSTLLTIDLARRFIFDEKSDLEPLRIAIDRSVFLRVRLMRLARQEAERRCTPHLIRKMEMETEFRMADGQLFIDIELECPLAESVEMEDKG